MPEPENLDLRKFLDKSVSKTSLSDLQRKGVSSVKVLDQRTLEKLIQEAVTRIVSGRKDVLTEPERQKIAEESRRELDKLIREYTNIKRQNEAVSQDRSALMAELENLQKQLELTQRVSEEKIRGLEHQLEQSGGSAPQGAWASKLEELAKRDDQMADKISRLFNRTIEGLSRKIASLKPGGLDTEVEYKPSEVVLENLLKQELESNLGAVEAKQSTSRVDKSAVDAQLEKLKSIREGFGKPKENK